MLRQWTERVEREFAQVRPHGKPNGDLRGSWCSLDLGARAAKTDFTEAFRLINPISSQLIHGTFGGLAMHFDLTADEHRIFIPPSMEYCAEALVGGHMCMLANVGTLADTFNWVPCNPIPKLVKDLLRLLGQAGRAAPAGTSLRVLLALALHSLRSARAKDVETRIPLDARELLDVIQNRAASCKPVPAVYPTSKRFCRFCRILAAQRQRPLFCRSRTSSSSRPWTRGHAIFALPDAMRTYRTALLLILCFALPCIAQAQTAHLTAAEAKNHMGETSLRSGGRVANAHGGEKAKGLPSRL